MSAFAPFVLVLLYLGAIVAYAEYRFWRERQALDEAWLKLSTRVDRREL